MQMTLNFDAGLCNSYGSCRELIAARVHQNGRPQKAIAADMDYSPSDLSRKLSQNPDDSRRLTLDDAERFMEVTRDYSPVYYWVEKYLATTDKDELQKRIAELQSQLEKAGKQEPLTGRN